MSEFIRKLPAKLIESIQWYTGGNFDKFNENLRKGKELSKEEEYHLQNISEIFYIAPPIEKPLTVYKGIDTLNIYNDKAFISTSLNYNVALRFAERDCCILQITVSPGSKVLYLSEISREKDEAEVLLDRNGSLKITGEIIKGKMKVLFVTYYSNESEDISQTKKAISKFDRDLIIERIVDYFEDDEDKEFIDDETIKNIYIKITGENIESENLRKIKIRLGLL